ncbi:gamma-glutamyltransferase [bacterium]|nr:gamma-glutamyltransferase [bacterium]
MVVAESAPAARAGLDILRKGGNAVDAAVATSLALGVTNASSCGIGGLAGRADLLGQNQKALRPRLSRDRARRGARRHVYPRRQA